MSLYNLTNGVNIATFFVLPMLGKHPDEYPRFRDCFVKPTENGYEIQILSRTGSVEYCNEHRMFTEHPCYLRDFVIENDKTYAMWCFSVPTEWENDFKLITIGEDMRKTSREYKNLLYRIYPKLKTNFDKLFHGVEEN